MFLRLLTLAVAVTATSFAGTVLFPVNPHILPAIASFGGPVILLHGPLTQNDTIDFTVTGAACLQSGGTYCTNAAGIVTVAGSSTVGQTTTFTGTVGASSGTFNFGGLLISIAGVGTRQIFPANAANGLGSGAPPGTLVLPTTSFAAMSFPAFTVTDAQITFFVADTNYGDNSSQFVLTQGGIAATPAPGTLLLTLVALLGLLVFHLRRRRAAHGQ